MKAALLRRVTVGSVAAVILMAAPTVQAVIAAPARASAPALASAAQAGQSLSATVSPMWQTNGTVLAIAAAGGDVFVGGDFTRVRPPGSGTGSNTVGQAYLAEFSAATGDVVAQFKPVINGPVTALAVSPDGTTLYVGGTFSTVTVGSVPETTQNLAAFDIQSGYWSLLTAWQPDANASVLALATSPDGSTVYVGGDFGRLDGDLHDHAGAVSGAEDGGSGTVPTAWAPSLNGSVTSIAVAPDDSRVLVGGYFTSLNGTTQVGIGSTNPSSGLSEPWTENIVPDHPDPPSCTAAVKDIVISDATGTPTAYVAAEGTGGGCFDGDFAATVSTGTLLWQSSCLGATQALAVVGDWLYKGSHAHDCAFVPEGFPQSTPEILHHLLDQSLTTGILGHWTPNTNNIDLGPRVMATDGTQLFVGGDFTTVNGIAQEGITRFEPGAGKAAPRPPGKPSVASTSADVVAITFSAVSDPDVGTLTYAIYRNGLKTPIARLQATSWPWALPVLHYWEGGLKPGSTYFYSVTASTGVTTSAHSPPSSKVTVSRNSPGKSYEKTVLAARPLFLWCLDQTSGSVAGDSSPNKFNGIYEAGTTRGVPGPIAGEAQTATSFNGATGLVTAAKVSRVPKAFSVEGWFRTTTQLGGMLIGFGNSQKAMSAKVELHIYMMNDGQLVFGIWNGTAEAIETRNVYNDGAWHYVVATMGATGMAFYVDGQLIGTNRTTPATPFAGYWRVGGDNLTGWSLDRHRNSQGTTEPNSYYFDGVIGDVAAYPSVLSEADVAAGYAAATARR